MLIDGLLSRGLDHHVEWLDQKTLAIRRDEDVAGGVSPLPSYQRRRHADVAGVARPDAGLDLASDGAIPDETDPERLCERSHSAGSVTLGTLRSEKMFVRSTQLAIAMISRAPRRNRRCCSGDAARGRRVRGY